MSQNGKAGRDLVQVGRDYIQYIHNNARSGNWRTVFIALIPLFLLLYGAKTAGETVYKTFTELSTTGQTQNPLFPLPDPEKTPIAKTTPSPSFTIDGFKFPQDACGDESTGSNNTWYPVFINGADLGNIRQKYCRDAIQVTRQTGEKAIQVASFITYDKAQRFAQAVGGDVGEPIKPVSPKPSPTPSPPVTLPIPPTPTVTPAPNPNICVVTISNSLVALKREPETFSREIIRVPPGNYASLDYQVTNFSGLSDDGWFLLEAQGRKGWVKDDTWTIESKTRVCP
ncbi:MAG: hypothetical protein DCF22_23160 [Leptolyngbya sp.]|nr:MAG: hypothetical protein DCF22_23160 [Leptolyngbya sp.]